MECRTKSDIYSLNLLISDFDDALGIVTEEPLSLLQLMRASQRSPKYWIPLLRHLEDAYVQLGIPLDETYPTMHRGGILSVGTRNVFFRVHGMHIGIV